MKKNAIIGLVLGIMIGAAAGYAQTVFNYSITGVIYIPAGAQIELSGVPQDRYGAYYFDTVELNDAKGSLRFGLINTGSNTLTISYAVDTPSENLHIRLEGYEEHSTYGDKFELGNTCTLDRGLTLDCRLVIEDLGATPNTDHTFTLSIQASD